MKEMQNYWSHRETIMTLAYFSDDTDLLHFIKFSLFFDIIHILKDFQMLKQAIRVSKVFLRSQNYTENFNDFKRVNFTK